MGFFCGMLPAPRMQQLLFEHNCNTFAVWVSGTAPLVSVGGSNKLAVHFEPIDQQLRHARRLGMGPLVWFLASRPESFPQTLDLEKALLRAAVVAEGKVTVQPDVRFLGLLNRYFEPQREAVGPPVRDLLEQWVRLVADHAAQAPWPELALCPMDQPEFLHDPSEQWAKDRYADTAGLIRQASGKRLKVFGLIRQPVGRALIDDCDLTCIACLPVDPGIAAYARQHNQAMWTYAAARYDCPVPHARFLAGVEPMHIWTDGLLIWALEWGQYTAWRYLDGDVVPQASLLGIREGGDDRRYAEALLRLAKDTAAARAVIDRLLEPTRAIPTRPLPVQRLDYYPKYVEYAGRLDAFRRGVVDEILRLSAAP
jgi:hypothetical protein